MRYCACDTRRDTYVKLVQCSVLQYWMMDIHHLIESHHMMECHHMMNKHNIEQTCCIFSPGDIFTLSCLDPHWPSGHLRSKHITYSWYDGKSSYDGTPSYDDFPSYDNFPSYVIWWIAIISTIQCMMELHHIMMLIHHKLYDSYKLYYCRISSSALQQTYNATSPEAPSACTWRNSLADVNFQVLP